jgi:Holliday junction DNA helicase RuvA
MFNSIRGKITGKSKDSLCIETGGIEWEMTVPGIDLNEIPAEGEEARIFTWLLHREDMMKLFGFSSEVRRSTFLELQKVEGIGPKAAVKIMSGIGQEELEKALDTEDLGRLTMVPGLGKKTAQKMILALKGKLAKDIPPAARSRAPYADLVEALAAMGYDRRLAEESVKAALPDVEPGLSKSETEKRLFKAAVLALSGA